MKYDGVSNSYISNIIDEWVKGERNRQIMKRRFIDCIPYEPLAEEFELSVRHIKRIIYKNADIIEKHINV